MSATLSYNPIVTTNASGGRFNVQADGFVQGVFSDDPAVRYELAGGVLNSTETLPMWGGILIYEYIPGAVGGPAVELGSLVGRMTSAPASGAPFAFSVYNQAHHFIQTAQSQAPIAGIGMSVHYFRNGSNARIQVACDPSLASLESGSIGGSNLVSWDFVGQQLVPYTAAWTANTTTAGSYSSGSITFTTNTAHGVAVGSWFTITGASPTGYNGTFKAITGTTGSTLVTNLQLVNGVPSAIANPGSYVSGGALGAGGGALPVRVLKLSLGNSMTVYYNSITGFASWARNGNAAEILI